VKYKISTNIINKSYKSYYFFIVCAQICFLQKFGSRIRPNWNKNITNEVAKARHGLIFSEDGATLNTNLIDEFLDVFWTISDPHSIKNITNPTTSVIIYYIHQANKLKNIIWMAVHQ
jgi:hypothetical protein